MQLADIMGRINNRLIPALPTTKESLKIEYKTFHT
jgi:hypothetical protein